MNTDGILVPIPMCYMLKIQMDTSKISRKTTTQVIITAIRAIRIKWTQLKIIKMKWSQAKIITKKEPLAKTTWIKFTETKTLLRTINFSNLEKWINTLIKTQTTKALLQTKIIITSRINTKLNTIEC